jgi:leader peptidase (prepilin peptidase)/N-methyltransferase
MDDLNLKILSGIFGAIVGSFLNVCIFRLPEGISIIKPGSHCPLCKKPVKPFDNVPMLSYLILMGRCRNCKGRISIRYPIVEAISTIFSVYFFSRYGFSFEYLSRYILLCSLIVITFIDISHKIIPDWITLPGILAGFGLSFLVMEITPIESVAGIFLGGGSLYSIAFLYHLIAHREGMGGGDVKLIAMIGAFTGYKGVIFTIFTASATGTFVGIPILLIQGKGRETPIPFGPFLALGTVIYMMWGREIVRWYLGFGHG